MDRKSAVLALGPLHGPSADSIPGRYPIQVPVAIKLNPTQRDSSRLSCTYPASSLTEARDGAAAGTTHIYHLHSRVLASQSKPGRERGHHGSRAHLPGRDQGEAAEDPLSALGQHRAGRGTVLTCPSTYSLFLPACSSSPGISPSPLPHLPNPVTGRSS